MAQWVKDLLYKGEDQSSIPSTACTLNIQEEETECPQSKVAS